jgi:outer membrane protein OmpA-like peptidoglycan-associated protein
MKRLLSLSVQFLLTSLLSAQAGLKVEYYNGVDFDEKVATKVDSKIDMRWNDTPPVPGLDPHYCSIRWTGILNAPETGTYTFSARVDDGIRVWVGNVLVIDNWQLNDDARSVGNISMKANTPYNLKVEYFNGMVEGEVRLIWDLPNATQPAIIEPKYFTQTIPPKVAPQKPANQKVEPPAERKNQKPAAKPEKPAAETVEAAAGNAVISKDTLERYVPKNVLFEQGKSVMLAQSKPKLDELSGFLLRNPKVKVKIEGHTDIIGDMDMNQTLSEERAKVVGEYLANKGIAQARIEAKGYGSSRPLVKGSSKKGYEENRRVVFILY